MKRKITSYQQRRQRELAWLLYISAGMEANLHTSTVVNGVTFQTTDRAAIRELQTALRQFQQKVQLEIRSIP